MKKTTAFTRLIKSALLLVSVTGFILVQGCSDSNNPVVITPDPVNPTGYYTGSATVKESDDLTELLLDDLQVMINGTRFTAMSVSKVVLYDGTITDITDNDFTAEVTVYVNGQNPVVAAMTGTITEGSQIVGDITGAGAANGSFTLTYSPSNSDVASLAKLDNQGDVSAWAGRLNLNTNSNVVFQVDDVGSISSVSGIPTNGGDFAGCRFNGTFTPISNTNLYTANLTLFNCVNTAISNTNYTGLVTTEINVDPDDVLVLGFSNGEFSGSANFDLFPL